MFLWCRFVRREKEIALAQCEAYEGEALRHKQRVEHQDRELKELQEALNSEREKMQVYLGDVTYVFMFSCSPSILTFLKDSRFFFEYLWWRYLLWLSVVKEALNCRLLEPFWSFCLVCALSWQPRPWPSSRNNWRGWRASTLSKKPTRCWKWTEINWSRSCSRLRLK